MRGGKGRGSKMGALLRAEFCKSRRDLNVAILPLALLVAVADSRYIATAQDGTEYTWPLVVANTLFVSANYLMPACLTLLSTSNKFCHHPFYFDLRNADDTLEKMA